MKPRVDQPEAGFYRVRLVKNGPHVPLKIWFGHPLDPVTGEELDRAPRWNALRNGEFVDIHQVWPECAGSRISELDYKHLLAVSDWAQSAPQSPEATPRKPINPLKSPPIF